MAAAVPLQQPEEKIVPFLRLPMSLTSALFEVSGNAGQVVLYVARHTIGWQNAEIALSADEFMHGRRKPGRAGGRYDDGLKKIRSRNTLARAIQEAASAGMLQERPGEYMRDAHIFCIPAKFFSCSENEQDKTSPTVTPIQLVQKMSKPCSENEQEHVQKMSKPMSKIEQEPSRQTRQEAARRVAIDTSIDTGIDTKEDTNTLAPTARASKDAQVASEDDLRYPLKGHAAIAHVQEAPTPSNPEYVQLVRTLDRLRNDLLQAQRASGTNKRISDLKRQIAETQAKLSTLSDSQAQPVEPERTTLYEEKPQEPRSIIRARYEDELDELRAIADDAKDAWLAKERELGMCVEGSKRRVLRVDSNLLQERYDEAHWKLAVCELAVEFMEQGMSHAEAVKEAAERLAQPEDEPEQPPTDDAPAALFPEATPEPQPEPTLYEALGTLFFDMTHASKEDKQAVAVVAERIKKRGLTVEDVQNRYRAWMRKFEALKAKTIWHFEKNIAAAGVC